MNNDELIEQLLNDVEVPDMEGSRSRALAAIIQDRQSPASGPNRSKRMLAGLAAVLGAGVLVVSPAGQALADLVAGGEDPPSPPPMSQQDEALTKIACSQLGSQAASVSWCNGAGATEDEVKSLLEGRGYKLFIEGPIIAVKSPDGTVMTTGTGTGPDDFEGVEFPIHLWGAWLAGPTDQDALDYVEQLRGTPAGGSRSDERDQNRHR